MDKLLMMSILDSFQTEQRQSAGPWADLLRLMKAKDRQPPEFHGVEGHRRSGRTGDEAEVGEDEPRRALQGRRRRPPRFAPEFDGLHCFETIVSD